MQIRKWNANEDIAKTIYLEAQRFLAVPVVLELREVQQFLLPVPEHRPHPVQLANSTLLCHRNNNQNKKAENLKTPVLHGS